MTPMQGNQADYLCTEVDMSTVAPCYDVWVLNIELNEVTP